MVCLTCSILRALYFSFSIQVNGRKISNTFFLSQRHVTLMSPFCWTQSTTLYTKIESCEKITVKAAENLNFLHKTLNLSSLKPDSCFCVGCMQSWRHKLQKWPSSLRAFIPVHRRHVALQFNDTVFFFITINDSKCSWTDSVGVGADKHGIWEYEIL